jgi:hypothetical protein
MHAHHRIDVGAIAGGIHTRGHLSRRTIGS